MLEFDEARSNFTDRLRKAGQLGHASISIHKIEWKHQQRLRSNSEKSSLLNYNQGQQYEINEIDGSFSSTISKQKANPESFFYIRKIKIINDEKDFKTSKTLKLQTPYYFGIPSTNQYRVQEDSRGVDLEWRTFIGCKCKIICLVENKYLPPNFGKMTKKRSKSTMNNNEIPESNSKKEKSERFRTVCISDVVTISDQMMEKITINCYSNIYNMQDLVISCTITFYPNQFSFAYLAYAGEMSENFINESIEEMEEILLADLPSKQLISSSQSNTVLTHNTHNNNNTTTNTTNTLQALQSPLNLSKYRPNYSPQINRKTSQHTLQEQQLQQSPFSPKPASTTVPNIGNKSGTNTLISSQLDRELLLTTIEQFKVYVKSPFKLLDFIASSNKPTSSRSSSLAPSPLARDDFSTPSSVLGGGIGANTVPRSVDSIISRSNGSGIFEEYAAANMAKSFLQLLGKHSPQAPTVTINLIEQLLEIHESSLEENHFFSQQIGRDDRTSPNPSQKKAEDNNDSMVHEYLMLEDFGMVNHQNGSNQQQQKQQSQQSRALGKKGQFNLHRLSRFLLCCGLWLIQQSMLAIHFIDKYHISLKEYTAIHRQFLRYDTYLTNEVTNVDFFLLLQVSSSPLLSYLLVYA